MKYKYLGWLAIAASGCGGSAGPGAPAPADAPPAHTITVKAFPRGVTAVDRTTANADLVAVQDGDGDWTEVTGTAGVYTAAVASDRYAVAVGCRDSNAVLSGTEVYYQTVAEASELSVNGCAVAPATVTVDVTVTGLPPGTQLAQVWIGDRPTGAVPDQAGTIRIGAGVKDLFVASPVVFRAPAVDVERDQALTLDVHAAAPVEVFPVTVDDPAGTSTPWSIDSQYLMPHNLGPAPIGNGTGALSYAVPAAAERLPGDVVRVRASQSVGSGSGAPTKTRTAIRDLTTPAAVTVTPPGFIDVAAPMIDTSAVSQLAVELPIWTAGLGHTVSSVTLLTNADAAVARYLAMYVRPGWADGHATVTLHAPDLRNLASWTTEMELGARTEVDWTITAVDQDQPLDAPIGDRSAVESDLFGKVAPTGQAAACDVRCRARFVRGPR